MPSHWTTYLVMLAALGMVIARNRRGRRLRVEALWVLPAMLIAVAAFMMSAEPAPGPALIAGLFVALAAGGAAGWQRGRFTRIALDRQTHTFTSQASPAGMIFLAVLFAARFVLRAFLASGARGALATVAATDVLMAFSVGLVVLQRLEMWLRCRRMLTEAKAQP